MISQAKKILNGEETIHLQDLDILAERLSTAHMNRVCIVISLCCVFYD